MKNLKLFQSKMILFSITILLISLHYELFPFDQLLLYKEPRIKDYKNNLTEQNSNFPETMNLFFQELKGNYAIFYDLNGQVVYYQYRENKFDYKNKKLIQKINPGLYYQINGKFLGLYVNNGRLKEFVKADRASLSQKKELSSIPTFEITSIKTQSADEILL